MKVVAMKIANFNFKQAIINKLVDEAFAEISKDKDVRNALKDLVEGETRTIAFIILPNTKGAKEITLQEVMNNKGESCIDFCVQTTNEGIIRRVSYNDAKQLTLACFMYEDVLLDLLQQKYTPYFAFTKGWMWFGKNDRWLVHVPILSRIFKILYDYAQKNEKFAPLLKNKSFI